MRTPTHARETGEPLFIIQADIEKAYPTASRALILQLLVQYAKPLVRNFVGTYEPVSTIKYPGCEPMACEEGLYSRARDRAPMYATNNFVGVGRNAWPQLPISLLGRNTFCQTSSLLRACTLSSPTLVQRGCDFTDQCPSRSPW